MIKDFTILGTIGAMEPIKIQSGGEGVELRIACSDFRNNEEVTDWFNVVMFGRPAGTALEKYNVGDQVWLTGGLRVDTWDDKTTGKKRSRVKFNAFRCRRISKGKRSKEQGDSSRATTVAATRRGSAKQGTPSQQSPTPPHSRTWAMAAISTAGRVTEIPTKERDTDERENGNHQQR